MTTKQGDARRALNAQAQCLKEDNHYENDRLSSADTVPITQKRVYECGRKLQEAGAEIGRWYNDLSAARKQDITYVSLATAGLSVAVGGWLSMVSGAAPVLGGYMIATGAMNSTRSLAQYFLRRYRADRDRAGNDQQTEMVNSSLSALTNAPQALSGLSLAGITAVSSYGLRIMNKARQFEDARKADMVADDVKSAYTDMNWAVRAFNRVAAESSRALDRLLGKDADGNHRVDQIPGLGMMGRGAIQTVEGIGIALINPVAGACITGAGIIYTSAAALMRDADTAANDNSDGPRSPTPRRTQLTPGLQPS